LMTEINRTQFGELELDQLSPQVLATLFERAGAQMQALKTQLQATEDFGLKYFIIADTRDKVVFSDQADYTGRTLTDTVPLAGSSSVVRIVEWKGERVFEATVPIENKSGKRLGYGRIAISTEPVDALIRDIVVSSL
jgi:hypothetical protein